MKTKRLLVFVAPLFLVCACADWEVNTSMDSHEQTDSAEKVEKIVTPNFVDVRAGNWAFSPGTDNFANNALLNLRNLNESAAGATGFIKRTADGRDFVRGDGASIRFWAAHSTVYRQGEQALADHARFLAKRGVNLVRWHGNIEPKTSSQSISDIDTQARTQLWQYVKAMKQEGIYVILSPFYPGAANAQPNWGIPRDSPDLHGLLFFDPILQNAYKEWLRKIFTPVNPYTGVALKDEPAIALIQLLNEDSLLFWTVGNLAGRDLEILQEKFAQWAAAKYGSLQNAFNTWQGASETGDSIANSRAGIAHIWYLTQPVTQGSGTARRYADQTQFFSETMRAFNAEMASFLRQEIGVKQLINLTNWKTADPVLLEDSERYAYTSTDVLAVNRYFGDTHIGQYRGWAIVNGDKFQDRSVLQRPENLPTSLKQVSGYPMLITESSWVPPLSYQSEGPFLVSIFQSLNGVDGFLWFNMNEAQWRHPSSANGYLPSIGKWVANTPSILGGFPAAALMYRKNYVKRGKTVVHERRRLTDLWNRRVAIISEAGKYDPNRDAGDYAPDSNIKQDIDRLTFLVGPVEVTYNDNPANNQVEKLENYIDSNKKVVRSITNEIRWDYGQGICSLATPKAVGITGSLIKAPWVQLNNVVIQSKNDYATVLVTTMDDQPFAASKKILVQVGTRSRPTGWQQRDTSWVDDSSGNTVNGYEIVNYGRAPWQIGNTRVNISVRNQGITKATLLDPNGFAVREVEVGRAGDIVTVVLPAETMYLILS